MEKRREEKPTKGKNDEKKKRRKEKETSGEYEKLRKRKMEKTRNVTTAEY